MLNKKNSARIVMLMTLMASVAPVFGVDSSPTPNQAVAKKADDDSKFSVERMNTSATPEQMLLDHVRGALYKVKQYDHYLEEIIGPENLQENSLNDQNYMNNRYYTKKELDIELASLTTQKMFEYFFLIYKDIPEVLNNLDEKIPSSDKPSSDGYYWKVSDIEEKKQNLINLKKILEEKFFPSLKKTIATMKKESMEIVKDAGISEKEKEEICKLFDTSIKGMENNKEKAFLAENNLLTTLSRYSEKWNNDVKMLEEVLKKVTEPTSKQMVANAINALKKAFRALVILPGLRIKKLMDSEFLIPYYRPTDDPSTYDRADLPSNLKYILNLIEALFEKAPAEELTSQLRNGAQEEEKKE